VPWKAVALAAFLCVLGALLLLVGTVVEVSAGRNGTRIFPHCGGVGFALLPALRCRLTLSMNGRATTLTLPKAPPPQG